MIQIINQLTETVNSTPNQTTSIAPCLLFQKEKEYLLPLPTQQIIDSHLSGMFPVKVQADQMVYYQAQLQLYHNTELIRIHPITDTKLNYHQDDYHALLKARMPYKEEQDLIAMTKENLARLDYLKG